MVRPTNLSRFMCVGALAAAAAVPGAIGHVHNAGATATFSVTSYGATGNGVTDDTAAISYAIAAAQAAGGGTVYFPAGTYALTSVGQGVNNASLHVDGTVPVTLQGAGRDTTKLVEHVMYKPLLSVKVDHTVIDGLSLDTQTYTGKGCLGLQANYTTLSNSRIRGGTYWFAMYYPGPGNQSATNPVYNYGNRVINVDIDDQVTDDGFSFSFQDGGLIQNVTHHGSRLAIYRDRNVTVNGYTYTTGVQGTNDTDGFWVTAPSQNITINNFTSNGSGGIVGANQVGTSTNITISNERLNGAGGYHLEVGNVNGITITGASFGPNVLRFRPSASVTNAVISASSLTHVAFAQPTTASVSAQFQNDTFGPFTLNNKPAPTFQTTQGGPTSFTVTGGNWSNSRGGFFSGINTTYTVSSLLGYLGL